MALRFRIEAGTLIARDSLSGVGYYTKQLAYSLARTQPTNLFYSPLFATNALNDRFDHLPVIVRKGLQILYRLYRKLDSYGLAPPCDLFFSSTDVTLFPANFSQWRTVKSRLKGVVIHDLTFLHFPEHLETKNLAHLRRVAERAVRQTDFVVTVSEAVKKELCDTYAIPASNVIVTHVPPHDATYQSQNKTTPVNKKYSIPTDKYILFVGTLEPRKNLITLINAYRSLPEPLRRDYSLVLAGGSGWQDEELRSAISRAQSDAVGHVVSTGYFDLTDGGALQQHASVSVLPAYYEGFGMPVLEAMACGTPTIVSDIPVLRETSGSASLFADPQSAADFTEKIEQVLTDNKLAQSLIKAGYDNLKRFSWQKNADILVKYCQERLK